MRSTIRKSLLALAVPTALAVVLLMFVAPPKVEAGRHITCSACVSVNYDCDFQYPATHNLVLYWCGQSYKSVSYQCVDRQGHDVCK